VKRALVTGCGGFIGAYLVAALQARGVWVRGLVRGNCPCRAEEVCHGDITRADTLEGIARGVDVVFHLAGVSRDTVDADREERARLHTVNCDGTAAVLAQAMRDGARRFVLFSSVKAQAGGQGAYGESKHAAEQIALQAAQRSELAVTVLRPAPVYGPGSQGNLQRLLEAVRRGRVPPLPRGGGLRVLVDVRDLVEVACTVAVRAEAAGRVYVVNDGQSYSARQIYEEMCRALGRPVPSWAVPAGGLRVAAAAGDLLQRVSGRPMPFNRASLARLLDGAWYDGSPIREELGVQPRFDLHAGLASMVEAGGQAAAGPG